MPKAVMSTRSGATITIEGTQEELVSIVTRLESPGGRDLEGPPTSGNRPSAKLKTTPTALISELLQEGFFRKPRELGAVGQALKERGHFYPVTTLSPALLRLVRRKELRRLKDKSRWTYVG